MDPESRRLANLGFPEGGVDPVEEARFGDWFAGIHASEDNPQRCGMYVRTVIRSGRTNSGVWFELTDGRGNFWEYKRDEVEFLRAGLLSPGRPGGGVADSRG